MSQLIRGYEMRIQRLGSDWMGEKQHAWAPAGTLPAEWEAIKQDETVVKAVIFRSAQRSRRADKRILSDEFTRSASIAS